MPTILHLPGIISEATRNHLQSKYANTIHMPENIQQREQQVAEALQHILPATRPDHSSGHNAQPNQRVLPSQVVTEEEIDDAYVAFIMYCNPSVPSDTDTTELKKLFRSLPKSDNKTFNVFTLFKLIWKLEDKEIKTWAQLAIDLGVEKPDFDKGQSAQKVQQYSVRLKRWMHAMHIDAFFEYLLGKSHTYWTQLPSISDTNSGLSRDGVSAEEDLALRALLPETRPKRGRKKAEDRDNDEESGRSLAQRRRLESPTLSEDPMLPKPSLVGEARTPATAHHNFNHSFDDRMFPWSAIDTQGPLIDNFRWTQQNEAQTPLSAYPRSAITPSSRNEMWNDGSMSAVTPNKSRQRRRHGPGVSSAWTGNNSTTGKVRGRPPNHRSVTDGQFSTFPATPITENVPTINLEADGCAQTPVIGDAHVSRFLPPNMVVNAPSPPHIPGQGRTSRPSRLGLQLQVPERQGGSVRLATPPPVLGQDESDLPHVINIESSTLDVQPQPAPQTQVLPQAQMTSQSQVLPSSLNFTPMMEYFTTPSTGQTEREANFQNFVSIAFRQTEDTDRTNVDALESHFICEILAADWYDARGLSIERCSIDEAANICKQVVKNLRTGSSSTEAFLINLSALAGGPLMTKLKMTKLEVEGRTDYECHCKMRFGSLEGDLKILASVNSGKDPTLADEGAVDNEVDWKQRYLDMQQQIRQRDEKVGALKKGVLDALLAS